MIPNESVPLYGGWTNIGSQTYSPGMTSTAPDSLATFLPHNDYPVQPGSSFSYTVSLRFTPEGASASAADAYASFAARYPSQMTWTDKRIIGTAYLTSAPSGDPSQPGGFPTNPRRYFNDPGVNITTPAGLQAFQDRMLAQAASNVKTAQSMSAQGVITWDIEGEQYPQSTSYVCSPDQIAAVAPEMESVITDSSSAYFGQKLDDAYFKTMSGAGLKVGLCLRPQMFNLYPNGTAGQVFLTTNAAIIAELENKARYAMTRWGATIFYVDSTVDVNGGTLDPAIFQQLITDLPGLLFIPEESTPRYYAYTAPFYSLIFHTDLGTPASTYNFYPQSIRGQSRQRRLRFHAGGLSAAADAGGGARRHPHGTRGLLSGERFNSGIDLCGGRCHHSPRGPGNAGRHLECSFPGHLWRGALVGAAQRIREYPRKFCLHPPGRHDSGRGK